jgi:hypothetical protein
MHLCALKENIHYVNNITFEEQRQACAGEDACGLFKIDILH